LARSGLVRRGGSPRTGRGRALPGGVRRTAPVGIGRGRGSLLVRHAAAGRATGAPTFRGTAAAPGLTATLRGATATLTAATRRPPAPAPTAPATLPAPEPPALAAAKPAAPEAAAPAAAKTAAASEGCGRPERQRGDQETRERDDRHLLHGVLLTCPWMGY